MAVQLSVYASAASDAVIAALTKRNQASVE